jgi:RNA polymerase sigma-70 factor, ECF subfamily
MDGPLAEPSASGYATAAMVSLLLAVLAGASEADDSLLRRMAAGDARALRQLYDRCSATVFALVLRIVRNGAEAEEIMQDTFVDAWKRARAYDPRRGTAVSFVLTIARSRALDKLRSRAAEGRATQAFAREDAGSVELPIESAQDRQQRERIQTALAALPTEQRTVLELAYFEGLSQSDIARKTSEPLGTVKTRCRLALEKLALALAERAP